MCVTDRHDMTLAVKVALKPYTINLSLFQSIATKRAQHNERQIPFYRGFKLVRFWAALDMIWNGFGNYLEDLGKTCTWVRLGKF